MFTSVNDLRVFDATTLEQALSLLKQEAPLVPIAGCTDLYLQANLMQRGRFLNLWNLKELRFISVRSGLLTLGPLATFADLLRSAEVKRLLPILALAVRDAGGPQIQNRGTIGGNIATGSPAGDTLPVLAATDATLVLQSSNATRRISFSTFYSGYRMNVLRPDELITAIEIQVPAGPQWFRKVGTREGMGISRVSLAGIRNSAPRVALGSAAPVVARARKTEQCLAARGIKEACTVLMEEISPIDDHRAGAAYRRRVAANLLAQFWRETES